MVTTQQTQRRYVVTTLLLRFVFAGNSAICTRPLLKSILFESIRNNRENSMIGNNFKITRNDDVTSYWVTKFSSFSYESSLVEFNTVLRICFGNKIATFFFFFFFFAKRLPTMLVICFFCGCLIIFVCLALSC